MRLLSSKSGFTLVEVLVASTLFAVIGSLALTGFIQNGNFGKNVIMKQRLQNEAQFILQQLAEEITNNAIDYEEYFNQSVIWGEPGMNFGHYAVEFYKPLDATQENNCHLTESGCLQTGQNPPNGDIFQNQNSNAFMISPFTTFDSSQEDNEFFCNGYDPSKELKINKKNYVCVKRLFLIDPTAAKKTFIAPEIFTGTKPENSTKKGIVLSKAEMEETENFEKIFTCQKTSICKGKITNIKIINQAGQNDAAAPLPETSTSTYPNFGDLKDENNDPYNDDFIGFTSKNVNIKKIEFYITPVEDPQKAYNEKKPNGKESLIYPYIIILLEIEPIENIFRDANYPSFKIQKKIYPLIPENGSAYPPSMECSGQKCTALRKQ